VLQHLAHSLTCKESEDEKKMKILAAEEKQKEQKRKAVLAARERLVKETLEREG
jgi:hypothetical protein